MRAASRQSTWTRRRGLTLIEMLVVAGLMVLIMSILVGVFTSATSAVSTQRIYASIDQEMRRGNTLIRRDLAGVTAHLTPPLNPADGLGYFVYGEQALSDLQGEDTDDYLAFTAKAPAGQPFTGVIAVPANPPGGGFLRVPVTSQYAEIIYFLRNGNLYRRVFLILPERQYSLSIGPNPGGGYTDPSTGLPVSWLAWNDISARPSQFNPLVPGNYSPIANTLADLTNRENRAFSPRFSNDFVTPTPPGGPVTGLSLGPDKLADDFHSTGSNYVPDGLPDYVPTLYALVFSATRSDGSSLLNFPIGPPSYPGAITPNEVDVLAFPYLYPFAYSQPDPTTIAYGPIHSLDPTVVPIPTGTRPNFGNANDPPYNHAPLDLGDSLPYPVAAAQYQTWWGFPTKKETMSQYWTDPVKRLNDPSGAPYFALGPLHPADLPYQQTVGLSRIASASATPSPSTLPPMTGAFRLNPQPFNDAAGSTTFALPPASTAAWVQVREDDLIMTNVRSFDVKALDTVTGLYHDLGYMNMYNGTPYFLPGTGRLTLESFAHEGRMPPLIEDYRADAQFPNLSPNIGDDQTGVVRLRRVWDSWSTDYSYVPSQSIFPAFNPPYSLSRPAMPSYPAPYPAPLRGIQIQIRVTDPSNQRIKFLTIRQDFSDRL